MKDIKKNIKVFPKKKKKKSNSMGIDDMKRSLKIKNKNQLSVEKNIIKYEKIKMLHK